MKYQGIYSTFYNGAIKELIEFHWLIWPQFWSMNSILLVHPATYQTSLTKKLKRVQTQVLSGMRFLGTSSRPTLHNGPTLARCRQTTTLHSMRSQMQAASQ
ncbi:hypothetical protein FGO68_gene7851 [Halteria grandinella]|uniref:Uncharacterized protein n=1 Tax=Halteria grandinella TaxID=5974 RepID=A0A8J8NKE3_HALGN|nr:hypothetical protein FGO68_gene7851 [Halteria grandinella]